MDQKQISKIKKVPLREAFKHEAHSFTTWLESNIEALADELGMRLTVLEREKSVGSFKVDLLCDNGKGVQVIIENQLEKSNHDHLGKLLTYLVNLEAKIAIWIVAVVNPEHQRVIDWLNETIGADYSFYLVQIQAIRIGESPYAPLFTVLAAPDEQTREIGEAKKEIAERHHQRREFWKQLLERSRSKTKLFSGRTGGMDYWLSTSVGISGINLNYLILKDGGGIDIYIDVGNAETNKHVFDTLIAQRIEIESEFGDALDWRRLDDKRACRIVKIYDQSGSLNEPERWTEIQDVMINAMIKFEKAIRPRLARIQIKS
ncbi:MAG: DUF4268 domain-containing protein [Anaerolineae bacterium]